ncbi:MAG: nitrophenyl compound nitroreductase subunit ArsF family protein [Paludibacter sp.]|nr:nitrophenyl compound nitroreductase subunit ArsF family protein [Paludibacter sp.]MDD4199420.1 nitrophenyl compound nitroreductase subunit ArsF family protein [Paludibacter sp.]MDD4429115.1 nitrophenyl compound nitroreductase subunit ArsF family protein [Paludibacter sp.]
MKKVVLSFLVVLSILALFTANAGTPSKSKTTAVANAAKVEVYYFHFTRRCVTCQAVETETKAAINALYPVQAKKGLVTFKTVNLEEKSSLALAKKCKAEGQSLLVISGNERYDLTDQGFMYAKSNPEKLKAELKKTIDPLIK